jgi:hypothetical protein
LAGLVQKKMGIFVFWGAGQKSQAALDAPLGSCIFAEILISSNRVLRPAPCASVIRSFLSYWTGNGF